MTPSPVASAPSKLSEILEAILAGLQIAAEALPVITQYKTAFGGNGAHLVAPIAAQAAEAHPATGAVVNALLAPPPTGN